jgi:hypothetical protein
VKFKKDNFLKRPPRGPSKNELICYLFEWCKSNQPNALIPDICKKVEKIGGYVIYGAPNNPNDQPAEFLNAHVKANIKKTVIKNRTISNLYQDVLDGFYGCIRNDGVQHKGVNNEMITGWIKKCENHMNQEIEQIFEKNIDIKNLWKETDTDITVATRYMKAPWTDKTLRKWNSKFKIVLN